MSNSDKIDFSKFGDPYEAGLGYTEWVVYIEDGKVGVDQLDMDLDWSNLFIIKRFGMDDDAQSNAQSYAYTLAKLGKLPLRTIEDEDDE